MTQRTILDRAKAERERLLSAESMPPREKVDVDGIPDEIKQIDRWVCWKWYRDRGRWSKMPINAHSVAFAKSNDPETWSSFDKAVECFSENQTLAGIGFVLGGGFAGVDLDKCYDPNSDEADEIVHTVTERFDSYTEISPTKTGVKILVSGNLPKGKRQSDDNAPYDVECYDDKRFFTITGNRWTESPRQISERTSELNWFHSTYVAPNDDRRGNLEGVFESLESSPSCDVDKAREALANVPLHYADSYSDWIRVGHAAKSVGNALRDDWVRWSSQSSKFNGAESCQLKWDSFSSSASVGIGTLIHLARESGWEPSWTRRNQPNAKASDQAILGQLTTEERKREPTLETVSGQFEFDQLVKRIKAGESDKLFNCGDAFPRIEVGPGILTLIGAPPGRGKSAAAMQMVFEAANNEPNIRVTVASLEMTASTLIKRRLAMLLGVTFDQLRFNELTDFQRDELGQLDSVASFRETLSRVDFAKQDTCGLGDLETLLQCETKPGLLLLDYIQLFGGDSSREINAQDRAARTMATARRFCDAGWAVIAVSAVNRMSYGGGTMAAFRDASAIEYSGAAAYLLDEIKEYEDEQDKPEIRPMKLRCVKNRNGLPRHLEVIFNGPQMLFSPELAPPVDADPKPFEAFESYSEFQQPWKA